jgi:hypothetical protein
MIGKLIWKDIKVIGRIFFLRIMPAAMLAGALFVFRYFPWHVYMVQGFIYISTTLIVHAMTEKSGLNEGFTASLPVSRFDIISARYLSTLFCILLGLMLWYLNGKAASLVFPDATIDFSKVFNLKGVFIAFVFFAAIISLFLPASFAFGKTGLILTFIPALSAAISTVPLLFFPYEFSYVHFFLPSDLQMVIITGSSSLLALLVSFWLSVRIYNWKNL